MKTRITTFAAGFICALLISALSVTALAASGTLNLTVTGINIKVNGEVFEPTDAYGNKVLVFAYQGTTYAPLRALAEAYDLEVGYDQASNLAMVGKPGTLPDTTPSTPQQPQQKTSFKEFVNSDAYKRDKSSMSYQELIDMWTRTLPTLTNTLTYEEFKDLWEYSGSYVIDNVNKVTREVVNGFDAKYKHGTSNGDYLELQASLCLIDENVLNDYVLRLGNELRNSMGDPNATWPQTGMIDHRSYLDFYVGPLVAIGRVSDTNNAGEQKGKFNWYLSSFRFNERGEIEYR